MKKADERAYLYPVRLALLAALCLLPFTFCLSQEVVDRMVAVINGRELITHTDLLWQLALQPGQPLDNPGPEDLNRALQLVINQRLVAQEAEKLPTIQPTDEEVQTELAGLVGRFASREEFYARLSRVGLFEDSEQLREIVRQRVAIDKYVSFRFRAFAVVSPQEVADYYRDVWVPRRRRQTPGSVVPRLEEVRAEVERELRENKVESDTDEFIEEARAAAEIVILEQSPAAAADTTRTTPNAAPRTPAPARPAAAPPRTKEP